MKQEIRDRNKKTRDRIKELKTKNIEYKDRSDRLFQQGQQLQQQIAQNNTERLKVQGAIEELEKQIA